VVAYREAGHAVGTVLVNAGLVVETVTIVPDGDYRGSCAHEDWREDLVPDVDDDARFGDWSGDLVPNEDSGEIGEHSREYPDAAGTVSSLGAAAEGMPRHGRPNQPVMAGTGFDQYNVWANAAAVLGDDIFRKAGFYHGPLGLDIDAALALVQRHSHFWRAVGLVAGALMRGNRLDGLEVEALVREAASRGWEPGLEWPPALRRRHPQL